VGFSFVPLDAEPPTALGGVPHRSGRAGHKAHALDLTVRPVSGSVMAIVVNLVAQGVLFVIELASLLLG
jgi:hypothetical protein